MTKFIKANGIKLAYDESGPEDGKNIVLIHGLSSSKETMYLMRDSLLDKYKVYTIDCRGHGESDRMANYTLEDLAKDVVSFTEELQLKNATAIGYSMGSFIALRAGEISDVFEKLILIGTKGDGSSPAITNLLKANGLSVENVSKEEYGRIMRENIFAPTTKNPENLRTMRPKGKELSIEDRVAEMRAVTIFDNMKEIDKVTAETMIISAEYDKIVPPERGLEVAEALNCRYELLKDAGHMMMVEKPKEIEDLIKDFIG